MLVVPCGVVRLAIGITPGEDGVDLVQALVLNGRKLRWRLGLDDDAAALGKINRFRRPEDTVLVDRVNGFHEAGSSIFARRAQRPLRRAGGACSLVAKRLGIVPAILPLLDSLDACRFRISPALRAEALRLAGE